MKKVFSIVERKLASILQDFPLVKSFVKLAYLSLFEVLGKLFIKRPALSNLTEIGHSSVETFKGYYDISPENSAGLVFAYASANSTKRKPSDYREIEIVIYKIKAPSEVFRRRKTRAFNWQQGARAHWIDQHRLIYNDFCEKSNSYVSLVWDVISDTVQRRFEYPIECMSVSNEFLSINFKRLALFRPDYGYFAHNFLSYQAEDLEGDGIWKVDLDTGNGKMLYSLFEIVNSSNIEFAENVQHKVNHLMFSPDGSRILAIHRYFDGRVRKGRLLLLHSDGSRITEIPTGGIVSHYCWAGNDRIVGYLNNSSNKLCYYSINIESMEFSEISHLNALYLGDGHPTRVSDSLFVTDTYPDRWGVQKLLLVDESRKNQKVLATLRHETKFRGESRCDLHPVYCPESGNLYFDSVTLGKRRMFKINLK